jgi:hypothetical protein
VRNRYGKLIDKGALYKLLNNRVYVGEAVHKGTSYPGEHQAITESQVREHLHSFTEIWSELFPAEQTRIVQLLVARVDLRTSDAIGEREACNG